MDEDNKFLEEIHERIVDLISFDSEYLVSFGSDKIKLKILEGEELLIEYNEKFIKIFLHKDFRTLPINLFISRYVKPSIPALFDLKKRKNFKHRSHLSKEERDRERKECIDDWLKYEVDCYYCKKELKEKDCVITAAYWSGFWMVCHKECKESGEKEQAYECQLIDRDCNDCFYFNRMYNVDKWHWLGSCSNENRKPFRPASNYEPYLDNLVLAQPCTPTLHECFLHRKDGKNRNISI